MPLPSPSSCGPSLVKSLPFPWIVRKPWSNGFADRYRADCCKLGYAGRRAKGDLKPRAYRVNSVVASGRPGVVPMAGIRRVVMAPAVM